MEYQLCTFLLSCTIKGKSSVHMVLIKCSYNGLMAVFHLKQSWSRNPKHGVIWFTCGDNQIDGIRIKPLILLMHLSMLSRWEGRPGIGAGFDSSHHPVVGNFDRFNGLSSNILLTFSCYFYIPQMPWGGTFEQKLSAQFKCPACARPSPLPSLTLISA